MDKPFDTSAYFNSAEFSDVLVRFSDQEVKAHRMILCAKSSYFLKCLGPDSQFKESADGVLELQEDDPWALEQMLRYIYTSQYPSDPSQSATWESHFNTMIVADKYDLPNLEKLAYEQCEAQLTPLMRTDEDNSLLLLRVVERSWEYPDRPRRFSEYIASLPAVSGSEFPTLFQLPEFRPWIDANPDVTKPLIEKHFRSLMRLKSFREKISGDGEMALQHLDRLLKPMDRHAWL